LGSGSKPKTKEHPMRRAALVKSVPQAIHTMKRMGAQGMWVAEECRMAARQAVRRVIEGQARLGQHLETCRRQGLKDRRNGHYRRHFLGEQGDIEVQVPCSRGFSPIEVVRAYARRANHVDRMILACWGLSRRKVAEALVRVLGERISPSTVSRIAKQLDAEVKAFHRRKLSDSYRVLMFDGVVIGHGTGAGAIGRPVPVALGIRPDGGKEIIDFRQAPGESQHAWEALLNDLYRRGLTGEQAERVVSDGGKGLLAALPPVYPRLPVQRCWAHKTATSWRK
jgi:transposase-like protein